MDSRTAAHVLSEIADLLGLNAENRFKSRAYRTAAKAVLSLNADDLGPIFRSGELAKVKGLGKSTLGVIGDLIENGESAYLAQLRQDIPEGVVDLMRVPGLNAARIQEVYEALGVATIDDLEAAARDGRLAKVKGFGDKTAERILEAIEFTRRTGSLALFPRAAIDAGRLRSAVRQHPDVTRAEIAGSVRRRNEVVRNVDIVAAVTADPGAVAASFARVPGVVDDRGQRVPVPDEPALYALVGLAYIPPEMREGLGELDAATRTLPELVRPEDVRGVLHCHSTYSDGVVTIAEMAAAAKERGWTYIGITDHSQSAFYAGGLKLDAIARQHDEIDALNASGLGITILKGIEADILVTGHLDYDDATLERFDYVIGSVHSRFRMSESEMTTRILTAMDDPRLTILGHPTGRLLLGRDPYPLDMDALLEKAAESGVALELNADPKRLDLDWRYLKRAKELGIPIEIGPDAHSARGLDCVEIGVGIARKGWLEASDILNARSADEIVAFAAGRRERDYGLSSSRWRESSASADSDADIPF